MDLRHLALILDAGRKAAEDIEDAGLSAALAHMTETAVALAFDDKWPAFNVATDFTKLAERYQ